MDKYKDRAFTITYVSNDNTLGEVIREPSLGRALNRVYYMVAEVSDRLGRAADYPPKELPFLSLLLASDDEGRQPPDFLYEIKFKTHGKV